MKDAAKNTKRLYNCVKPTIWRNKAFVGVSVGAKILWFYYMTHRDVDSSGCYQIPDSYAQIDLQWTSDELEAAKKELIDADLILYSTETDEVWPVDWFDHNQITGPKHAIGTSRLIQKIESPHLRNATFLAFRKQPHTEKALEDMPYIAEIIEESPDHSKQLAYPIETLPIPNRYRDRDREPNTNKNRNTGRR